MSEMFVESKANISLCVDVVCSGSSLHTISLDTTGADQAKSCFQNAQIKIHPPMCKVSSGNLLSIDTVNSVQ